MLPERGDRVTVDGFDGEWRVDRVEVHVSQHQVGAMTASRAVAPGRVTVVARDADERVCMGSNSRPACYLPLSECQCGEAS